MVQTTNWASSRSRTGHNLGMEITQHPKSRRVTLDDLQAELAKIIRKGLPLSLEAAGHVLPHLRSVVARAVHPDDNLSRVDSLNTLLTRFIRELRDDRLGEPTRMLFGLASGTGRTTLTARRSAAAQYLGYDPDHFRKRVEPEVIRAVADLVYRDMLRYKTRVIGNLDSQPKVPASHSAQRPSLPRKSWSQGSGATPSGYAQRSSPPIGSKTKTATRPRSRCIAKPPRRTPCRSRPSSLSTSASSVPSFDSAISNTVSRR